MVIVGLGNIGSEYVNTRHNIGFMVIEKLAEENNVQFKTQMRFECEYCEFIRKKKIMLVKPLTYMNNSGRAVRKILDYYSFSPENLIVVYDDINLEFGVIRIRRDGGAGGHNGIKSIIEYLGTNKFARIRLGINSPKSEDLANYVLSNFNKEEKKELPFFLDAATAALNSILDSGIDRAMNEYNKKHL